MTTWFKPSSPMLRRLHQYWQEPKGVTVLAPLEGHWHFKGYVSEIKRQRTRKVYRWVWP